MVLASTTIGWRNHMPTFSEYRAAHEEFVAKQRATILQHMIEQREHYYNKFVDSRYTDHDASVEWRRLNTQIINYKHKV